MLRPETWPIHSESFEEMFLEKSLEISGDYKQGKFIND